MSVNRVKKVEAPLSHLNFMSGKSFDITPLRRLETMAASCFFGEAQYYSGQTTRKAASSSSNVFNALSDYARLGAKQQEALRTHLNLLDPTYAQWRDLDPTERMERAIDEALNHDFSGTLQFAARLRNELNIRVTPQVIVVRAAHHKNAKGNEAFGELARVCVQRMDEPATQLAYHLEKFGRKVPTRLKRLWARVLEGATEFQLAKYKLESRTVKTVDVVNLCHANSPAIDKLMRGELKLGDENETWESIASSGGGFDKAFEAMGHMALLRNLRNLCEKSTINQGVIGEKLLSTRKGSRQLPFRYWSAYKALKESGRAKLSLLGDVERCMDNALDQLPRFKGKVISLCDNSGSSHGAMTSDYGSVRVSEIANLTGAMTGLLADEAEVGVFGDKLDTRSVKPNESIFGLAQWMNEQGARIGQGTEHGIWLFWDRAIRENLHYDSIFIYSDMQAGHGGLYGNPREYPEYRWSGNGAHIDVSKLIAKYRATVNPNVQVFLVQVAGYGDTLMPEQYQNTYILGGWSDAIIRYAHEVSNQN